MGWIRDLIDDLLDWFWDKIVRPVTDWLKDLIEDVMYYIRVFRHNMNEILAKWFANDLFFLMFLQAAGAAVFALPEVLAALGSTTLGNFLKKIPKWIKEQASRIMDINAVINLKLMNDILKVIWPDYKEAMVSVNEVLSQFAAELGEGSAFIHAYLSSARMIYMGTAAIVGTDMRAAELTWYEDATAFTKKVDDHFKKYAKDPSLIYYDFVNDYLIPAAEDYQTVSQAELEQIKSNYARLLELENGVKLVTDGIEMAIDQMPAVIEEQFRERWDDVHDTITDILDSIDTDVWPILTGLYDAFDEHTKAQMKINERVIELYGNPYAIFEGYLSIDEAEKANLEGILDIIVAEGVKPETEALIAESTTVHEVLGNITRETYLSLPRPQLPSGGTSAARWREERKVDVPSPFVTE